MHQCYCPVHPPHHTAAACVQSTEAQCEWTEFFGLRYDFLWSWYACAGRVIRHDADGCQTVFRGDYNQCMDYMVEHGESV